MLDEVKKSLRPIILFIDEWHTMIGAGGQAGQGDAANMLKPALARGELRTIAATTWAGVQEVLLSGTRRPGTPIPGGQSGGADRAAPVDMMRGLVETLERHHQVRILNEAVVESVRLSTPLHFRDARLPDKSISLLDTSRVPASP